MKSPLMPDMHSAMCTENVNIEHVGVATAPQMIFETQAAKARGSATDGSKT